MAEEASAPAPKKSLDLKKIGLFAAIGLNLIGSGVGLFLAYQATLVYNYPATTDEQAKEELEKQKEVHPEEIELFVYSMDQLIVNLSGLPKRSVRLQVSVEMLDSEGFEEVMTVAPKSRDSVLQILSSKTFDDLESLQGKLQLKDQIASVLNSSMKNGIVKDIYFSDFVMQ